LKEINHWVEIVASVFDAMLLLRILLLRLHRTYLFITLACVLAVFYDGVGLWFESWFGAESQELTRVFIYSRFLDAVLYPLAVWDVFEEIKAQVKKVRQLALARLISGLVLAAVFALVMAGMAGFSDENTPLSIVTTVGLVLWTGSSTASFAFLWTLQRRIRTDKIELPNNTFVWSIYFLLLLVGELLFCFYVLAQPLLNLPVREILDLMFLLFGMCVTGWCIVKLRGTPSDVPSAPENASL
jgi:hypothetical protein